MTSETEDIVTRLHGWLDGKTEHASGDLIREAATTIATLRAEVASLKTVMVAAAEEISAHWQAHCDAEGYGPQNLVRRLEEGIPSEYGYTAGAFATLRAEVEGLRSALSAIVDKDLVFFDGYVDRHLITYGEIQQARAAIDAAKADKEGA